MCSTATPAEPQALHLNRQYCQTLNSRSAWLCIWQILQSWSVWCSLFNSLSPRWNSQMQQVIQLRWHFRHAVMSIFHHISSFSSSSSIHQKYPKIKTPSCWEIMISRCGRSWSPHHVSRLWLSWSSQAHGFDRSMSGLQRLQLIHWLCLKIRYQKNPKMPRIWWLMSWWSISPNIISILGNIWFPDKLKWAVATNTILKRMPLFGPGSASQMRRSSKHGCQSSQQLSDCLCLVFKQRVNLVWLEIQVSISALEGNLRGKDSQDS